jgi:predicted nucleotidyltransferase
MGDVSALAGFTVLTEAQASVARRVIAQESTRREHLVVYLSGAHAYGFPSPDSDLDLKAVHVLPTDALLGLDVPPAAVDRAGVEGGVEVDYTSNEVGHVLRGLLRGNGNFLERVAGTATLAASPDLEALRDVARMTLSRRYWGHYHGFAIAQREELQRRPSVKRLLYVLRTTLCGAHLLAAREVVTDLGVLAERFGLAEVPALIGRKTEGERTPVEGSELETFEPLLDRSFAHLDRALDTSQLPAEPACAGAAGAYLRALRRSRL